jgi:hypothetical protein
MQIKHKNTGQIFSDLPTLAYNIEIGNEPMTGFLILDHEKRVWLFYYDDSVFIEDVQKKDVTEYFEIE